jgi:hypothetical protein
MKENSNFVESLIKTAPYRTLTPMKKAIKLYKEKHGSLRTVSKITGVSVTSLRRALNSVEAGRQVGQVGRPAIFNDKNRGDLTKEIDKFIKAGVRPTYPRLQKIVCLIS